ncbi:phosphatidate cytidylyltransferase, mitochondrial-like [Amphiura filiformis]|uniref:phosphatidate cytidylyltransferase, mitochondrial-like n=1 Tax=Amphiura filiformis TaxID=82378 RepID=UPI003B2108A5
MAVNVNRFLFTRILGHFPQQEMTLAFAYGSGVFKQIGNTNPDNMIDFVFAVDDPVSWHRKNMDRNPSHYSALRFLGPKGITVVQDRFGAGVYYNTLVRCEKRLIKYGVVSTSTLKSDLIHWDTLYLGGRLHKPVEIIKRTSDTKLFNAMRQNQWNALYTSLLMLPEQISEEYLFKCIAGLSYSGDFRMVFGEDKNKVHNIVKGNMTEFRKYYKRMLESTEHIYWNKKKRRIEQDRSPACLYSHMEQLPSNLKNEVVRLSGIKHSDVQEVFTILAREKACTDLVKQGVKNIVKSSTKTQSIKGIFTAGLSKTYVYSMKKLTKMWKGGKQQKQSKSS